MNRRRTTWTRARSHFGAGARGVVFLLPLLLPGCRGPPQLDEATRLRVDAVATALEEIRRELRPLDLTTTDARTVAEELYLRHYGLELEAGPGLVHHFGTVMVPPESEGGANLSLATHVWRPESPRGTVFLVHGYYDHTGLLVPAIRLLVPAGYAVVAFDLPGHGLSGGARAAMEEFGDYRRAFAAIIDQVAPAFPRPWHMVGHSTGAAVVIDRILLVDPTPFERVVLLAPLVRSAYWSLSRFGSSVVGLFTDEVRRLPRKDSSDEEFLRFRRQEDPLRYDRFPLAWYDALVAWVGEVEEAEPVRAEVLLIQGEKDDTVSWEDNLELLGEKLPGMRVLRIPGANHQLLHEAEPYRSQTLEAMMEFLDAGTP